MRNPKELTRAEIIRAASRFRWRRKMPKWTAIVEGRELPARPLVLEAAGVPPNDPTNSHQAVDILKRLGFETRYVTDRDAGLDDLGATTHTHAGTSEAAPSVLDMISAATRLVPEEQWDRVPADLAKNIDHYLYGGRKKAK